APGAMAETTSFAANNFNINGVLRWEIRPGSTLYAVYTHGAFNSDVFHRDGTLSRQTLPALLQAPSDDVLHVNLSCLFRSVRPCGCRSGRVWPSVAWGAGARRWRGGPILPRDEDTRLGRPSPQ